MDVSNKEFLQAVFGGEWDKAHITSFADDPGDIKEQADRMKCWSGGPATARKLRSLNPEHNQYYTVSLFGKDEEGVARRRKALFDACFVIALDDVEEKIPLENAKKLPKPSYVLRTSADSYQWGYILAEPEERREVVDNLQDGLVAQGLCPDGKDPGQKGVTRYVRLPGGSNTKKKRYVDGKPFKCELTEWNLDMLHRIEDLALAFDIDLDAPRNDGITNNVSGDNVVYRNHPIWDKVTVTGHNSDWTMVDCPNGEKHSCADLSGAAILIREDGSVGFQCHHGSCGDVTGLDVVKLLDIEEEVNQYVTDVIAEGKKALATNLGLEVTQSDKEDRFKIARNDDDFNIMRYIYLPPENRFYDVCTNVTLSPEALKNLYLRSLPGKKDVPTAVTKFHQERDANLCIADGIGWIPWSLEPPKRSELVVDFGNRRLVNSWAGVSIKPKEGDISAWYDHVLYLIPDEQQRDVVLDYLALVLQRPIEKPAFTILHRGYQGNGKDLMLKPLTLILGVESAGSAKVEQITDGWGDYMAKKKFLILEEVDKAQNKKANNALKTVLAPTATGYQTLNMKGGGVINQYDAMCTYMMSNRRNPIQFEEGERRYFVVDSWVKPKSEEHYKAIDRVIHKEETLQAIMYFLLNRDISGFNPKRLPAHTTGYKEIMDTGRFDYEILIEEAIRERKAPFNLPLFTLTTLKAEASNMKINVVVNSLIEAVEKCGYVKCRGTKKVAGVVQNTPVYFIKKDMYEGTWGRKNEFEYYEKYQSGGM